MIPAVAGTKLKWGAVEAILARWLEFGGGRASRLDITPDAGWRGEPETLLWACTVGSKVASCPKIQTAPNQWVPAVEVAAQIRMDLASAENRLHQLEGPDRRSWSAAELAQPIKELRKAVFNGKRRLDVITKTPSYREGMDYLGHELWKCCALDDDTTFLVYVCRVISQAAGPQARLRMIMAQCGLTQQDVAVLLGVTRVAVSHWCCGVMDVPPERLRWLEDWLKNLVSKSANQKTPETCYTGIGVV